MASEHRAQELSGQAFQMIGDEASSRVYEVVSELLIGAAGPESGQAVLLGGYAGLVRAWVVMLDPDVTQERFVEAMVGTAKDFAAQAYAGRRALLHDARDGSRTQKDADHG